MREKFEKFKILFKWALKSSTQKVLVIIGFFEFGAIVNFIQNGEWNTFILATILIIILYFYLILHLMYPSFSGRKNYNIKLPLKTQRKLKLRRLKKL